MKYIFLLTFLLLSQLSFTQVFVDSSAHPWYFDTVKTKALIVKKSHGQIAHVIECFIVFKKSSDRIFNAPIALFSLNRKRQYSLNEWYIIAVLW